MSITLFCLVIGNTIENAFDVETEKNKSISHLKKVIKEFNAQTFANIESKDIKLWQVDIPIDKESPKLTAVSNLNVNIKDEIHGVKLLQFDYISDRF